MAGAQSMDWVHLFTSYEGRISRQPFWITLAVFIAIDIASMLTIEDDRWSAVLDLVLTYPQFAVCAKRGHDRNTPTWVVGLFFALAVALDLMILGGWVAKDLSNPTPLVYAFGLPLLVLGLALIVDLGFRRGTVGPNRYGPDPLDAST
jgi:uncharacterized membrane protein YhaH (DUF805 family)